MKRICEVDNCTEPFQSRGLCHKHYVYARRHGMTTRPSRCALSPTERLWSYVDKRGPDECWPWLGGKDTDGYGLVAWGLVTRGAHRIVLAVSQGIEPPPELQAAHSCDNRVCCNPAHLRWATPQENVNDRTERDRTAIGGRHPNASSPAAVARIRALVAAGLNPTEAAREVGVHPTTARAIVKGLRHRESFGSTR